MSYEDLEEARAKRAEKEATGEATGKGNRGRKVEICIFKCVCLQVPLFYISICLCLNRQLKHITCSCLRTTFRPLSTLPLASLAASSQLQAVGGDNERCDNNETALLAQSLSNANPKG